MSPGNHNGDDRVRKVIEDLKNMGGKAVMTLSATAKLLGMHYQTIWRAIREGRLASLKRGRLHSVRLADVASWMVNGSRAEE